MSRSAPEKGDEVVQSMESALPGPAKDNPEVPTALEESEIAALLQCRFGDGMAYLPRQWQSRLLEIATRFGFVDTEGYLTRRGRKLMARHHFA